MRVDSVRIRGGTFHMSIGDYVSNPLWPVLVDTVHAMVMYPHHKAYVRDVILHEQPDVTPQELAAKMGHPLGESLVILHELKQEREKAEIGLDEAG